MIDFYEELVQLTRDNPEREVGDLARAFIEHHPGHDFDDVVVALFEIRRTQTNDVVQRYTYRVVVHSRLLDAETTFDIRAPSENAALVMAVRMSRLSIPDLESGEWTVKIADPNRRPSRAPMESPPQIVEGVELVPGQSLRPDR